MQNKNLKPKVKVCCIQSISEANAAIRYGASMIGLVSEMPSGPGTISEVTIREIAGSVPDSVNSCLLTSKRDSKEIITQLKFCQTDTVQIVDDLLVGNYEAIRVAIPEISIIQVIHVINTNSVKQAQDVAKFVDIILLDSGNPASPKKILGGSGKIHNWRISSEICQSVAIPVYLAGGLNSQNIRSAVNIVNPAGVDVCSGVRTKGKLDIQKLSDFMDQLPTVEKFNE